VRYDPATGRITGQDGVFLLRRFEAIAAGMGATLRKAAAAHRRAVVHLTVRDWAGNKRIYDVPVRLSS
jgi:hypothetical protein